jgi:hypothetical protein
MRVDSGDTNVHTKRHTVSPRQVSFRGESLNMAATAVSKKRKVRVPAGHACPHDVGLWLPGAGLTRRRALRSPTLVCRLLPDALCLVPLALSLWRTACSSRS